MVEVSVPVPGTVIKKKAYHHGDLRNAIIITATARARAHGDRAIVLREIAADIGVSATAAYRHFANRQQLVEEVAVRGFQAMGERIAAAPVVVSSEAAGLAAYVDLRNACLALVGFCAEEPAWARMMIETFAGSSLVEAAGIEVKKQLQGIVDRGVESGMFVPGTLLHRDRAFWAGVDGLSMHAMYDLDRTFPADGDRAATRVLDLVLSDLLTEAGRIERDEAQLPPGVVTDPRAVRAGGSR